MASEVYTLKVEGMLAEQYRMNTFHFLGGGVDTDNTHHAATDLITAWNTTAGAPFRACLPSAYHVYRVSARRTRLKPSAYAYINYAAGALVGTRGAAAAAQQASPSVFLVPALGTKTGGKIFMPAVPKGDLVDNTLSAGYQTAVNTFIATLTGGLSGGSYTWQLVIYSYKLGSYSLVQSHSFSPFIGFIQKRKLVSGRAMHHKNA